LLTQTTPTELSELADAKQGRAGLVRVILDNATKLHQWDKETPQTILQVGTVSNLNILVQGPQADSNQPAIPQQVVVDVTPQCQLDTPTVEPQ
jgi:hypothetical protein